MRHTTRMLPNFLIIGSQKAGTSTLYRVLHEHPEVFMPEEKELNFFFLEDEHRKGLDHYARHFEGAPAAAKAVGEASPGYICHPAAPGRIHRALPDVKLVLTVRDPIARAYSQYWDNRRQLAEPRHFAETLDGALTARYDPRILGYFSRGTYIQYIRDYLRDFPREALHVVVFDDLRADPKGTFRRLFEFLGVDPDFEGPAMAGQYNPASTFKNPVYRWFFDHPHATARLPGKVRSLLMRGPQEKFAYPPMDPEVRARLSDFYRPFNAELAEFLGRALPWG